MKLARVWWCTVVGAIVVATTLQGQQVVAAAKPAGEGRHVAAVFARTVTLTLDRVPIAQALTALETKSNVSIQYREEVLESVTALVNLRAEHMPLGLALRHVLANTGLEAIPFGTDIITIRRAAVFPQPGNGILTGKIVHATTRQPITGAIVTVDDSRRSVTTDQNGAFRIAVPAGAHTISVKAIGFTRHSRKVTVEENTSTMLDIALLPSASVLDEVVVTGTVIATERKAISTPITIIHGEDLEKRGITRLDELFRGEVPGVFALDQGPMRYSTLTEDVNARTDMYVRGSTSLSGDANPVKTYVDGVELLDPAYLGTIDPHSIERIEIITGPQAATIYGSGAIGGVMQIFTKTGGRSRQPEIRVRLRYGVLQNSFSNGKTPKHQDALTVAGGQGTPFSYSANVSYDYTGQWRPDLWDRRVGASLGATYTQGALTTTGTYSVQRSTNGTWRFNLSTIAYGILPILEGPDGRKTRAPVDFVSRRISESVSQTAALNMEWRATPRWHHRLTLGQNQSRFALTPVAPDFGSGTTVGSDTLFATDRRSGQRFTWNYNTSHQLTAAWMSSALTLGVNGAASDQLRVAGCLATAVSPTVVGCSSTGQPNVSVPMDEHNWGGFLSWRVGIAGKLFSTFGVRAEQGSNYGRNIKFDVTPTNGFTYVVEVRDITLKFMASYGRAVRSPTPEQRLEVIRMLSGYDITQYASQLANPDLRPERSRGPQGGLELYAGSRASFTINHYTQTVDDLIQAPIVDSLLVTRIVNGAQSWQTQAQYLNVGKVRQYGWESTGALYVGIISLQGTYSWNDSRVLAVHPNVPGRAPYGVGQSFLYLPTHIGSAKVGYASGPTSLTVAGNFIGAKIVEDPPVWGYKANYARMLTYGIVANPQRLGGYRGVSGYRKVDMTGSHRVSPQLTVQVNILNLGNTFTADQLAINPSLGRQTTLGLSYAFNPR